MPLGLQSRMPLEADTVLAMVLLGEINSNHNDSDNDKDEDLHLSSMYWVPASRRTLLIHYFG